MLFEKFFLSLLVVLAKNGDDYKTSKLEKRAEPYGKSIDPVNPYDIESFSDESIQFSDDSSYNSDSRSDNEMHPTYPKYMDYPQDILATKSTAADNIKNGMLPPMVGKVENIPKYADYPVAKHDSVNYVASINNLVARCKASYDAPNLIIDAFDLSQECLKILKKDVPNLLNWCTVTVSDWRLIDDIPVNCLQIQFVHSIVTQLSEFRNFIAGAGTTLEEISFKRAYFQDEDAEIFTMALAGLSNIKKISFLATTMSDRAARGLAVYLSNSNLGKIESLEMENCAISESGWKDIMTAIYYNPYLRSLSLKDYMGPVPFVSWPLSSNRLEEFTFSQYKNRFQRDYVKERQFGTTNYYGSDLHVLMESLFAASNLKAIDLSVESKGHENHLKAVIDSKSKLERLVIRLKDRPTPEFSKVSTAMQRFGEDVAKLFIGKERVKI